MTRSFLLISTRRHYAFVFYFLDFLSFLATMKLRPHVSLYRYPRELVNPLVETLSKFRSLRFEQRTAQ